MTRVCAALGALLVLPAIAAAAPARPAPPLPAPAGAIVYVSSESQLRTAVSRLASNTTIVVTPAVYVLQDTICINGTFTNVGIRRASDNADDVVLKGPGMANPAIPHGIWVGGGVAGVTNANLTIRDSSTSSTRCSSTRPPSATPTQTASMCMTGRSPQDSCAAGSARRAGDSDVEWLVGHDGGRQHVHRLPA
jgi:hypothetical protein